MSFLNFIVEGVRNFLPPQNPTQVLDVKTEKYSKQRIYCRDDSMVMYYDNNVYDIVLNRPYNETLSEAYSLCRCDTCDEAEVKFLQFQKTVPTLVNICKDFNNAAQIQKLCDTVSENPSWSLAHLVTYLGLPELLSEAKVAKHINSSNPEDGISPLQLAIQKQNVKLVQALLTHNASLKHLDNQQNSVLHYAAQTNKQILTIICEKSKDLINSKNAAGHSPIHMACLADKPECVYALVEMGANPNSSATQRAGDSKTELPRNLFEEDMKHGGTPLHWVVSRQMIQALVNVGCDINARNFDERTPVHVMVQRNRLECVVALLSLHADCNVSDKHGDSPLHLAVSAGYEAIVKALIVFGADINYRNGKGVTPRHAIACQTSPGDKVLWLLHAVGAARCPLDQDGCNSGCKFDLSFNGVPPPQPLGPAPRDFINMLIDAVELPAVRKKGKGRLLCLDGGGIRGLVLVVILLELEKHIQAPITHCFDWIAATSTGGILSLSLAAGKSLEECLCMYFKMKEVAFAGKRPYPSEAFEGILKEVFGETTTMAALESPNLMITATFADRSPVDLHLFRNYPSPASILDVAHTGPFQPTLPPEQQLLWHVARATGAAPTYFRSFGQFIDGGLVANNPTLDALTEIHEYNAALRCCGREHEATPISLVVSLGTGVVPLVQHQQEVDLFRIESLYDITEARKLFHGLSTMGQMLVDQATQSDGRVVVRARAWCSTIHVPFFRFSPQMSEDVAMDERSDEKLTNMLWETKAYMHEHRDVVARLARLLKDS